MCLWCCTPTPSLVFPPSHVVSHTSVLPFKNSDRFGWWFFRVSVSIVRMKKGMWWFWQNSTNWRGRRTFDVIRKRDPLLKRQGALGWLSRCCTDESACARAYTHTHTLTPSFYAHILLCLYFPLKCPQKANKWHKTFRWVSFAFMAVRRREPMWSSACEILV